MKKFFALLILSLITFTVYSQSNDEAESVEIQPETETPKEADNCFQNADNLEQPSLNLDFTSDVLEEASNNYQDEEANVTLEPEEDELPDYIDLTLDGVLRQEVNDFRNMYLEPKWTAQLRATLENAIDYRLYVRNAIAEAGLPPELEYLPVVESNYRITAKSKSGALGLWQFMENSVKPFLTLNDYEDERLDPWKSTDAALKKLQDNYNAFGDWLIAIAAYNCGAGAMTRIIKKAGNNDFWYLAENNYLPKQTANYIPKLIAIADLAINNDYYDVDLPSHDEEFEVLYNEKNGIFDYLEVKKAYSLSQLATEMRIDASTLKKLNPAFTKGFTHPSHTSKIRLPLGMEETGKEALSKISPIEFPFKYKVESGDSLWSISRRYGVTVQQLCDINGIDEKAILKIGKIIYIPSK